MKNYFEELCGNSPCGARLPQAKLEEYAARAGAERAAMSKKNVDHGLEADEKRLRAAYERLYFAVDESPAARWLCDNYHLLKRTAVQFRQGKPSRKLPVMCEGRHQGLSRAFSIAIDIVNTTAGQVDREAILTYVNAYQKDEPLQMAELWALNECLALALVKLCARCAEKMLAEHSRREKAKRDGKRLIEQGKKVRLRSISPEISDPVYAEALQEAFSGTGLSVLLEKALQRMGLTAASQFARAQTVERERAKVLQNAIESLRRLSGMNWEKVYCRMSPVEKVLGQDEIYGQMDPTSRQYYRDRVTRISRQCGCSEMTAARTALALCRSRQGRMAHIGWWLCGDGVDGLKAALTDGAVAQALRSELNQAKVTDKEQRQALNPKTKAVGFFKKANTKKLLIYLAVLSAAQTAVMVLCGLICDDLWAYALAVPAGVAAWTLVQNAAWRLAAKRPVRRLPRLFLQNGVPENCRTLVTIPALVDSVERAKELVDQLESHYHACSKDPNIFYCLLADLPEASEKNAPEDGEIIAAINNSVARLNRGEQRFFGLIRRRVQQSNGRYMGNERKRGALMDLNRLILKGDRNGFAGWPAIVEGITYVLTLDADTRLPPGAAKALIGSIAHPLNAPAIDEEGKLTGYAVVAPRIDNTASGAQRSRYARLFSNGVGMDSYSSAVSEFFFDTFGEGNYCGKGIYHVACFCAAVEGRIRPNTVLSHDLIEGCYARTAFASDIALFDDQPARYLSDSMRRHRWIRGDWQLLPYVLGRSGLNALSRFKMTDNLRASLVMPTALAVLVLAPFVPNSWAYSVVVLLSVCLGYVSEAARRALRARNLKVRLLDAYGAAKAALIKAVFTVAVIPYEGLLFFSGIVKSLWRTFVSHANMLEWTTAAAAERTAARTAMGHYCAMAASPILATAVGVIALRTGAWTALAFCALWWLGPLFAALLSEPIPNPKPTGKEEAYLLELAGQIWAFFREHMTEENHFLPPDNIQLYPKRPVARRTSPTNIAMGLLAPVCAMELGLCEREEAQTMIEGSLAALERCEKRSGHIYNWIRTEDLKPLEPRFISAVDSGNLAAALLVLSRYFGEKPIGVRAKALFEDMDFSVLFDRERELFYIGASEERVSDAHYDLLASEARTTSLIAIAKGEAPASHWFRLGRPLTAMKGLPVLMSWSGTLFEYLMPELFMGRTAHTLLGESGKNAAALQRMSGSPWGISESGYYAFSPNADYRYRAFGLPGLGLSVCPGQRVIAPYACLLALEGDGKKTVENLKKLEKQGARGRYGFYEAVDMTGSRTGGGHRTVMSYMAHHQGMSLAAIANALRDGLLSRCFLSAPLIRSVDMLTQEREPQDVEILQIHAPEEKRIRRNEGEQTHTIRRNMPNEQVFLPGTVRVAASTDGSTEAFLGERQLYDSGSCYLYVKTKEEAAAIAGTDALVSPGGITYTTKVGCLEVEEMICAPGMGEVRILKLRNPTKAAIHAEVYAYCEPSLCTLRESRAHRAFQKLFLTARQVDEHTLCFARKEREKKTLLVRLLTQERVEWATDRLNALGRLHSVKSPAFLQRGMDGAGVKEVNVDPCALAGVSMELRPGEEKKLALVLTAGEETECMAELESLRTVEDAQNAAALCEDFARSRLRKLKLSPERQRELNKRLTRLRSTKGTAALWRLGISGDLPLTYAVVKDGLHPAKELAALARYAAQCGVKMDSVFLVEEVPGYAAPLKKQTEGLVSGIENAHVFSLYEVEPAELAAIHRMGEPVKTVKPAQQKKTGVHPAVEVKLPEVEFFNGFGGFAGEEYVMKIGAEPTPMPWCNVLANRAFGTVISESGGGFTWHGNANTERITAFSNDPVTDPQSEQLRICDWENATAFDPLRTGERIVRHGFGYSEFTNGTDGLLTEVKVFAANTVKAYVLRIQNPGKTDRRLHVDFTVEWEKDAPVEQEEGYVFQMVERGVNFTAVQGGKMALAPGETGQCIVLLGWAESKAEARARAESFAPEQELQGVKEHWHRRLGRLKVDTGDAAFDHMMNGWLLYQAYSSRLYARAGYYQAGGATGFRDQLQDVMSLAYIEPEVTRAQLLQAAARQFPEGDVLHWWHEPNRGVRTYIQDDRLFLPFVTAHYIKVTGDRAVLDEMIPYLVSESIPEGKHDLYKEFAVSQQAETLRQHCLRALRANRETGPNGLLKMGTGDWNDGMDAVGHRGLGESIWLSWFFLLTLEKFREYLDEREIREFDKFAKKLRDNIEKHAYRNGWYLRAFFDDGTPLGGWENSECRIDLISQSFAVLANGPKAHAKSAMEHAQSKLVDQNAGIIKLLTPPLKDQKPAAGYIQNYGPGLRENGGQYTHAAAWYLLALIQMGKADPAAELFSMLNPVNHATTVLCRTYKTEPYVYTGDIYAGEWPGRGGWSWYTGAAGWMYQVGLELIGFHMENGKAWMDGGAKQYAQCVVYMDGKRVERSASPVVE